MFRGNNIFTAEKIDAYSNGSSYYQHITDLDNGDDSTNNFIQLDILMEKKNTTTNNVTKGKISAQVKELTQESFDAFIYSAVTNAIIGIIFILMFSYFRTKYKHVYYPRFTHCYSGKQIKLIQPSTSFFGWFGNILSISDEEIFTHVGLDILALLKIFIFCLQLFSICCIYNLSLLMFGYGIYSISQIQNRSDKLWGHLSSVYLLTFLSFYLLDYHYNDFIKWRHRYLRALESNRNKDLGVHGRTIMIENIPINKQNDQALHKYFNNLFPNCVDSVRVTRNIPDLIVKVKERDSIYFNLINAKVEYYTNLKRNNIPFEDDEENDSGNNSNNNNNDDTNNNNNNNNNNKLSSYRPRHTKLLTGSINILGGEEVDSISYYQQELQRLNKELKEMVDADKFKPLESGIGFVTFHDSATANQAVQLLLTSDSKFYITRRAPEPRDIYWSNMDKIKYVSTFVNFRSVFIWGLTIALLFLWAIPVALIASLTKLDNLTTILPFLKVVLKSKATAAYIQGFIPTVILATFMFLLPYILEAMVKVENVKTLSGIDKSVSIRFLYFQVVNVLLVSALAGGIWSTLTKIINHPNLLSNLLAQSLPGTFFFFCNYIMLLAFSVYPYEILQLSFLIQQNIKLRLVGKNKIKRNELLKPRLPVYGYPRTYASVLLIMIITMVFSTIAPIIMPFSLLYFGLGWFVVRYMAKYVWQAPYESGGAMFDNVVQAIIIGLLIYQLTFIGLFYLKNNPLKGNLAWPLPLFTVLFYTFLKKKYSRSYKSLALEEIRSPLIENAHDNNSGDDNNKSKTKLIIESPQYMYAVKGNVYNITNNNDNTANNNNNSNDRDREDGNESSTAGSFEFDLPTAHFFQQPEYLRARIELKEPNRKDIFINDGEENVDMVNEGPYTMHIQSSMFEHIRMDGDDDGNDRNVGSNGENRYGNNIGKHITHVSSSTVFSMSLILAIIGVICIIVFREISPPPVIPHA